MSDESILGLLLRAHALCAAQSHGEEYIFKNISASNCYDQAKQSIESAIKSVGIAGLYVARQGDRKENK